MGNGQAFKAGQRDVAERFLVKLREGLDDYCRSKEMSMLAEIWHGRGDEISAQELLIVCLRKLLAAFEISKYNSDRKTLAESFQRHRSTFLRLFPKGEYELAKLGIPAELK